MSYSPGHLIGELGRIAGAKHGPTDPATGELTAVFPEGQFDYAVLDATGLTWRELSDDDARLGGEGYWVAVERDPATGELRAGSHNRNNSDAVAF